MLTVLVVSALAASPSAGSRWTWTFEDQRSVTAKDAPPGVQVSANDNLGKSLFLLTVKEAGADAPRRITLTVKKGPAALLGRTWEAENNYGEAALAEVGKKGLVSEEIRLMQASLGRFFTPDAIVEAANSGAPCDEATRQKVAEAVARAAIRYVGGRPEEDVVKSASAECKGKGKGSSYAVKFTLTFALRDQTFDLPWTGTVEVPADAWRANVQLQGTSRMVIDTGKKPIRIDSKISLRSRVDKQ